MVENTKKAGEKNKKRGLGQGKGWGGDGEISGSMYVGLYLLKLW